jgi:fucose permease
VALVCGTTAVVALRKLLPARVDQASNEPAFVRPSGPLVSLGILAFFCLVSEGAMADWSAVYLRETLGTDPAFAAMGYAAFSLMMAVGRLIGDTLRMRLHAVHLVQMSGGLAALGLGTALLLGHPVAALVGFGCVGLGLSNIVPVLFSAAGRTPGVATGTALAAVATAGYFGFLVGPPLIGFAAQATTLRVGLSLVVLFMALIALRAGSAARADLPSSVSGNGQP